MTPIKKRLSLSEFIDYVQKKDFGTLPPTFLVIHHTYKPTVESWEGEKTIDALDNYYRGLGWGGNGPHLFIADDGIWLFTDMYNVGIHAGVGNGTLKDGYSIGIEVVGNYDNKVWKGETLRNTLGAIAILQDKLKISDDKIRFHREFANKTCPGTAITKDWLFDKLNNKNSTSTVLSEKEQSWVNGRIENGNIVSLEDWQKYGYDKNKDSDEFEEKYNNEKSKRKELEAKVSRQKDDYERAIAATKKVVDEKIAELSKAERISYKIADDKLIIDKSEITKLFA